MAIDLETLRAELNEFESRLETFGRRQRRRAIHASGLPDKQSERYTRLRQRLDLQHVDAKLLWLEWEYDIWLLVDGFRRWLGRVDRDFQQKS